MNPRIHRYAVTKEFRWNIAVCLIIAAAVVYIYGQGYGHDFVSFDDGLYVYENAAVQKGLTLEGIVWAFSFQEIAYWHPLTWISHMVDCELFGLAPGKHHITGLFLHLINGMLLFAVLQKMTGNTGCSAFAAIIFAVHPINVETVAWISERKNVLSTFFWLLTMFMYTAYALKPGWKTYAPVMLFYLMGLMAKPMVITLPFALLLLDFWPLGRFDCRGRHGDRITATTVPHFPKRRFSALIWEKAPLVALSFGSVGLSLLSAAHHSIVITFDVVPLALRIENAVTSVMAYLGKLAWPMNLAVFYPYPGAIPWWSFMTALTAVLLISGLTLMQHRRNPFLVVGWLWFLVALFPVSGLLQGGLWPAMADRWAYVPFIGLYIILAWGGDKMLRQYHLGKFSAVFASLILVLLMVTARVQAGHWQNSRTLFRHAVQVTTHNDIAHNNLGAAYYTEGKTDLAIFHFSEAIRILPGYEAAQLNLMAVITESGQPLPSAVERLTVLFPDNPGLKYLLGNIHREAGRLAEAESQYLQALAIRPDFALAINNLAIVYSMTGEYDKALVHFQRKIELQPDAPGAYYFTACVYAKQGKVDLSVNWLKKSIESGFDDWRLLMTDENLVNIRHTDYYRELVHDKAKN